MMTMLAILAAMATTGAPAVYPVAVTLTHAGRVLGTPQLTVTAGEPASIETDRYGLKITVSPDPASDRTRIVSAVSLKRNGVWRVVATPTMQVTPGRQVTIEQQPETPGGPVTIVYLVQPPR